MYIFSSFIHEGQKGIFDLVSISIKELFFYGLIYLKMHTIL